MNYIFHVFQITVENMKKRKMKSFPKSGAGASNLGRAFAGSYVQSLDSVPDGYVLVVIREFQDNKGSAVLADTISKWSFFNCYFFLFILPCLLHLAPPQPSLSFPCLSTNQQRKKIIELFLLRSSFLC
jgi:hypothetical protein